MANARRFYLSMGKRLGVTGLINYLVNPVIPVVAQCFTLANARRFYLSMGKRLSVTGLRPTQFWLQSSKTILAKVVMKSRSLVVIKCRRRERVMYGTVIYLPLAPVVHCLPVVQVVLDHPTRQSCKHVINFHLRSL